MKKFIKNLKFAYKYAKSEKKRLILFTLSNLTGTVFYIVLPIMSAKIVVGITNNSYEQVILLATIILILNFASNLFHYVARIAAVKIYRNTLSNIEIDLGKSILKLKNKSLDEFGTGIFIERLTSDTSKLSSVFNSILSMGTNVIKYIGILITIFILNKLVFLYLLLSMLILYLIENKRAKIKNKNDKISRKLSEKVTSFISELVRGARDIKMLNSEDSFIDELSLKINASNNKKFEIEKTDKNHKLLFHSTFDLFDFFLMIFLILLLRQGITIPTTAIILHNYSYNVNGFMSILGDILDYIKDFNLSAERIYEIINSDKFQKESFGTKTIKKINGNFEFKNVTFAYSDKIVLKNLSFKINANETVAFVGKSGAGKTTIFNLLCKMYDNYNGEITIDNINLKELDKNSIRGNITVISQNPYIFNMSIRDNLKIVKNDLTNEEMINACKVACLDDFVGSLKDGYDTIIGEGGVNLSGGEKQRLAIARALIQKTEIILFDEATSALDNKTQRKIAQAINNMKGEYTILIIAHRLSTIIGADRILFLDDGKIEASGNHKYLLNNCPKYKDLYESEISKND